jgi:hypothetical protein
MSYEIKHIVTDKAKPATRKILEMDLAMYQRELEKAQENVRHFEQRVIAAKAQLDKLGPPPTE